MKDRKTNFKDENKMMVQFAAKVSIKILVNCSFIPFTRNFYRVQQPT